MKAQGLNAHGVKGICSIDPTNFAGKLADSPGPCCTEDCKASKSICDVGMTQKVLIDKHRFIDSNQRPS